jgi:predicted Zn-dependent protease
VNFRKAVLSIAALATAIGAPVASAQQQISLLRDAEIEKFLDDYSRPIFKAAGIAPDSIQILIVNDQTFNAFAGGRYMGMNTGTLLLAETPNEVEAVIAHEAGHIAGGHSARSEEAMANAARPMLLSLLLAAGAIAAGAPQAGIGIFSLGQNVGIANYLKYSRGQEATADQSSITYLDRLGHSSQGALEVWRKLRNSQIIRGDRINPYLLTHPMANERFSALQQRVESSPYYEVKDSPEEIARLKLIQAKIRGFLNDPNATLRLYPLTDQSLPAHYARAVAYYRNSQIDRALPELETLTTEAPDNPYFHELKGQILFEYGRAPESIEPHRKAVELLSDNALLRIGLARALLATDEPSQIQDSVTEFKRALLLEPDNSFAWFELARAYDALGDDSMANLATAESRYHAGAKPDAVQFARRAMAGLKRGTPEWRQAADIILASQPDGEAVAFPGGAEDEDPSRRSPDSSKDEPDVPDPTVPGNYN